jgi:hypothetical protein
MHRMPKHRPATETPGVAPLTMPNPPRLGVEWRHLTARDIAEPALPAHVIDLEEWRRRSRRSGAEHEQEAG